MAAGPRSLGLVNDTESEDIPTLASRCLMNLNDVVGALVDDNTQTSLREKIVDGRGRFRIWTSNLGALQPGKSFKSLEFRLRNSDRMRRSVVDGLERLLNVTKRLYYILSGDLPNRTIDFISEEDEPLESVKPRDTEPIIETKELCLGISSSISHLFSLSILIRRQRPKGRLPNLQNFVPLEDSADITYVRDKFPKLTESPWLSRRLGNAITLRRETIRYRQVHRQGLAAPSGSEDTADNRTEIVATTFAESESGQNQEVSNATDNASVFTSATSFMSSYSELDGSSPRIPDLSDMVLDGVPLQYMEPFECPYCRTIQNVANRLEWKKHVFSDLQPYVCTFEHCLSSPFESRHEWFQHEMENHRRQWSCMLCHDTSQTFPNKTDMAKHLQNSHVESVTSAQLDWLLEACQAPLMPSKSLHCLFCSQWASGTNASKTTTHFARHIARHLQSISLASIPLSIDGLEIATQLHESPDNTDIDSNTEERPLPRRSERIARLHAADRPSATKPVVFGPGEEKDKNRYQMRYKNLRDNNASIGSSFSDLDDASITQEALDEALGSTQPDPGTETGCLTCQKRKKKCDESKPECTNCVRGGFVCYGYPNQQGPPKMENQPAAVALELKPIWYDSRGMPVLDDQSRDLE
ncbi:hypothetical protein GGR51DRAFT_501709 [Nemania sp. FL0031]|nr:hypothetical protein GGR51DRAFT_501709 [Nemania sp. FL0031]